LVLLKPLLAGHANPEAVSAGMPGLASSQSKPSRPPEPEQWLPHETSFSPAILTHFPLRHAASFEQKHPPGLEQVLEAPLQFPNGQVKAFPMELGQPPSGQSRTAASLGAPPVHVLPAHVSPAEQAAPQAPQLALSLV
jgi:hypothetical protein